MIRKLETMQRTSNVEVNDIYSSDTEQKNANKNAVVLAKSKYNEKLASFVKNSLDRLEFADADLQKIIDEASEKFNADRDYVANHVQEIIKQEIASASSPTKADKGKPGAGGHGHKDKNPETIKVEFGEGGTPKDLGYGGGPGTPPKKADPKQKDPGPDAVTDLSYHTGPLIEDVLRNPDNVHDLNQETFKGLNKNNFSSVKESCESCDCGCDGDCGAGCSNCDCHSEEKEASMQKHSPYGVPKSHGGDSPENDAKMESCVTKVMKQGHSKESAIKICKSSLFKKSCELCEEAEATLGPVCASCNDFLVKQADMYGTPGVPGGQMMTNPGQINNPGLTTNCPGCGSSLQPGQQNCASCGYAMNNVNNDAANHAQFEENAKPDAVLNQRNQNPGVPGGLYPSFQGAVKEAILPGEMDQNAMPQPQAPVQMPTEPGQQVDQNPVKVDQGLSDSPIDQVNNVISSLANKAAAQQFSTPTDEEVQTISQSYGLDPNQVHQSLKVIATFGDITAVNGQIGGDMNTEGMAEVNLEGMGGRIENHEAEVPITVALAKVSQDLGMDQDLLYSQLKDSFGGQDLPQQYRTDIVGDHRFYLPNNMLGAAAEPGVQDETPEPTPDQTPTETQLQPAH